MRDKTPLVSICCITYNHEKYIRETIEGFLAQKTSFPIEIIIHDDASTDKTAEIIEEYETKNPELFVTILQRENQYSKGGGSIFARFVFPRAQGKYIALCEGDDYWTDPYKLQKQVDFLSIHENLSGCFHATLRMEGATTIGDIKPRKKQSVFLSRDILKNNGKEIATCSLMFKSHLVANLPKIYFESPVGDFPLKLVLCEDGPIGYINDCMGVYQFKNQNSWSANKLLIFEKHYLDMISFLDSYENWTSKDIAKYIKINKSIRKAEYIRLKIESSNNLKEKVLLILKNIWSYNIYYTLINIKKI